MNSDNVIDIFAALRQKQTSAIHEWLLRLGASPTFASYIQDGAKVAFEKNAILRANQSGSAENNSQFLISARSDGTDSINVNAAVSDPNSQGSVIPYVGICWMRTPTLAFVAALIDRTPVTIRDDGLAAERFYKDQIEWLKQRTNASGQDAVVHLPFHFALGLLGELLNRVTEIFTIDSPAGERYFIGIFQIDKDSPVEVVALNFAAEGIEYNRKMNSKGNDSTGESIQ